MISHRVVQNTSVIQGIFRRLSVSNGDIRISSNRHNSPVALASRLLDQEKVADFTPRKRSLSFGSSPIFKGQITKMSSDAAGPTTTIKTNRLALEKSPYLLQHSTNPVDWYPWGDEAFEKARKENKLIFLSVGYSTCHWCHVMEKESFENDSVAEIMNKYYVNVKVDREERPDVDKLYMSFIQATVGSGGWPMSVFLTPDLEPLAGGTYFPPEDTFDRPGFKSVLKDIAEEWNTKQSAILKSGKYSLDVLRKMARKEQLGEQKIDVPGVEVAEKCLLQLTRSYDDDFGGFSISPKFPQPTVFNFLFHMYSSDKRSEKGFQCMLMALKTLDKIAYGGIHDHVNSGFARYSVDSRWHVPHFEKMLYDQAQLAVSYCDAYVLTKKEFYADVVRDILTYVSRDLSHELGGFYGAEDADSYPEVGAREKAEGAFCVWEYDEIMDHINGNTDGISDLELITYHYSLKEGGNVNPRNDPHGELLNKNVLGCFGSYEQTARQFDISVEKVKEILNKCHKILYDVRQKRPKPHVDTKIITSWNGLMISGYAKAGFVLKDQAYINRAILAASFIKKYLYRENEGKILLRCCYKGENGQVVHTAVPTVGFLDDYAFLIRGLLDLYEASLDADWLQWAETLQEQQDRLFWDSEGAGYFTSPEGDKSILIRGKDDQDGAEPCGNSVAIHNLIRLANYLDRQDLKLKAGRTLTAFAGRIKSVPIALTEMISALLFYHKSPTQVFIAGRTEDNDTQALLDVVRSKFMPGRILAVADGPTGRAGLLYSRHETLARLKPVHGKPAAYVCRNFACSLPVTEPTELASSLDDGSENKAGNDGDAEGH